MAEAKLDKDMQHEIHLLCEKFTPHNLSSSDTRELDAKLKDPLVFHIFQLLEHGENGTDCFLSLFDAARHGQLKNHQTFMDLCSVFEDRLRRDMSMNKNLKYGIHYSENYQNFMLLMCGHGGMSAHQYSILQSQISGPSIRTLR